MNNRNAERTVRRRRKKLNKTFVMLLSIVVLIGVAAGVTAAYLIAPVRTTEATFVQGEVDCVVNDDYTVSLSDDTNTTAYVRVAIVPTWQDRNGNIYAAQTPSVVFQPDSGWTESDGYYYYTAVLDPAGTNTTTKFAQKFEFTGSRGDVPKEYSVKIDVIAEAIQATGGAGHTAADWGN